MARAEAKKAMFKKLRNIIKPEDKSGIKTIDVPAAQPTEVDPAIAPATTQSNMRRISDPEEVENALIERNIKHFSQAKGTPFTTTEVIEIFGIDGNSEATDDLINGKIPNISHLPERVQQILRKIAENPPAEEISTEVSEDEMTTMYKKWKERTSTSPSGCHLGHWHALFTPDGDDKRKEGYFDTGNEIMKVHANILNAATNSGQPLDRWTTVHSTMFAKTEGYPRINKLRVIHIYECDYKLCARRRTKRTNGTSHSPTKRHEIPLRPTKKTKLRDNGQRRKSML
jgi:hypothetical protein